jgi:hypothetical protein
MQDYTSPVKTASLHQINESGFLQMRITLKNAFEAF